MKQDKSLERRIRLGEVQRKDIVRRLGELVFGSAID